MFRHVETLGHSCRNIGTLLNGTSKHGDVETMGLPRADHTIEMLFSFAIQCLEIGMFVVMIHRRENSKFL